MKKLFLAFPALVMLAGCVTADQPVQSRPGAVLTGEDLPQTVSDFSLNELDRAPKPIRMVNPVYPSKERKSGVTGVVILTFVVTSSGDVRSASVVEAPSAALGQAALASVSRWKFEPGVKAGRKVNTLMRVPITFAISD